MSRSTAKASQFLIGAFTRPRKVDLKFKKNLQKFCKFCYTLLIQKIEICNNDPQNTLGPSKSSKR